MESLERAVALFAASSHQNADKKDTFESVSKKIPRQMENVKSHILTNGGKLNNQARCTREHAETRFRGLETSHSKVKLESEDIHKLDSFARLHSETGGFERAVELFSLARQNVEKRLKSGAEQKNSSEILACVSKEVDNIKSHILTDGNPIKIKLESDS